MPPRLMIADSEPSRRELHRWFFEACGFDVEVAHGGLDCLHRIRSRRPEVLVLDRDLLWGGGDGVLARMADEPELAVPHVFVCGEEDGGESAVRTGPSASYRVPREMPPNALLDRVVGALQIGGNRR